jgi:tripartite-type tricarboxylate transporter receptor subunit TctC
VPLQAGSASDVAVRLFVDQLGDKLGQRLTVENVTGGAGAIGAGRAASAEPDGHTIAALNGTLLTVLPHIQRSKNLAYDPFGSFIPIAGVATIPTFVGVHRDVPAKTVPELIALARARGGQLLFGSGGNGSPQHLAAEMFMVLTGTRMTHVPYRGATAAATDLAGGHVQAMFIAHTLAIPFLPNDQIRYIGFCGTERHPEYPNVPTVAEQGVAGFEYSGWTALFAVRNTPDGAVQRLRTASLSIVADQGFADRLARSGLASWPKDPASVTDTMRRDDVRWKEVVEKGGVTL